MRGRFDHEARPGAAPPGSGATATSVGERWSTVRYLWPVILVTDLAASTSGRPWLCEACGAVGER